MYDSCNEGVSGNSEWIPVAVWCWYVGQTHWSHREYSIPAGQTSSSLEREHGRSTDHKGASPKSGGEIPESKNFLRRSFKLDFFKKKWMSHIKNILTSSLLGQLLKKFGSETGSDKYDCSRLSRSPVGGSFVILTPFCKMVTGNWHQRECFYYLYD